MRRSKNASVSAEDGLSPTRASGSGTVHTDGSDSLRLRSWKEIAVYLDRNPRTVQLWEKYEGLPVRRHVHRTNASVYAYREEVDAWLRNRSGEGGGILASMTQAVRRKFSDR